MTPIELPPSISLHPRWSETPTGKAIMYGSNKETIALLMEGQIAQAIHSQAVSPGTYPGKRRHRKIADRRVTKTDRRNFSARTFWHFVQRANREARQLDYLAL